MTSDQPAEPGRLRVGFVPGVTLTKWRTRWHDRFPRVDLEVVEVPQAEQRRVLDAGVVDMCFVRLPLDTDGLHLIPLYEEVQVAWSSKDHPLEAVDTLTLADLAGEVVLTEVTPDTLQTAAFADAVLVVPLGVARQESRRDMVHRPITDAEPTRIGLAWHVDDDHPWIDEFIGVVRGRTANSSRSAQERSAQERADSEGPGASRGESPAPARGAGRPAPGRAPRHRSGQRPGRPPRGGRGRRR